jgi:hypothetical protein
MLDDVILDGEPLSPELVLVCPDLAERARALLPDRPDWAVPREEVAPRPSARVEPVDDLVARFDGIAADWRQVDRRLAQLERAVSRMEAALAVASTPPAPWLDDRAGAAENEGADATPASREAETRAPTGLVGPLVVVVAVIAAMVAVELLPSVGERPRLALVSEGAVPTAPATTVPSREARPEPPPATTVAPRTPTVPQATTTTTSAIEPARVFLWPAASGAAAYEVTFLRDGRPFYSARVAKPRLALPERVQLGPGSYRWTVRPRTAGEPLGNPIVDSTFTVERS